MAEINVSKLLNKLLPEAEEEAGTVYNKGALGTLRSTQDVDNAGSLALASGNNAPLTQKLDLSGIDVSKLPATNDSGFLLVGNPQDKGFTLGSSSDISRPPVPYKPQPEVQADVDPSNLPAVTGNVPDNSDVIDISPTLSKWQQYKKAIIPTAAAGAAGAGYLALSGKDNTPAASAAQPPQSTSPADDIPDSEYDAMDSLVSPDKSSNGAATAVKPASSDDSDEDEDDSTPAKSATPDVTPNIASVQKLQNMQQRANQLQALIGAARGATQTAYAMSGKANPFDQQFQTQMSQAGQLPGQYQQLVDFQKQDPNSAISQTYRQMASQLGMPISDQTSGSEIEKAFPQIVNIKTREDMIEARKEYAQSRIEQMKDNNFYKQMALQDRATQRQAAQEQKQEQQDVRRYDTYGAKLGLASSRTVLGQAQNQIYSVDRVDALLNGHASLNDLTPQEMVETAKGLDRVISGGASTLEGSKQLDPATAKEWIASQMQKITNNVHSANGGDFLARIQHNLQNEKNVAVKQAANQAQVILAGSGDLAERNPDRYKAFLEKANIHPDVAEFLATGTKPQTMFQQQQILKQSGMGSPNAPKASANQPAGTQPLGSQQKQVVKKGYNPKTNQTQYIYSDGTKAIVDGQQ